MRFRLLVLLCAALVCAPAAADDWPSRPLRLLVPVAPGGQPDIVGRLLAASLSERLRQPVVVENRPGAQTNAAMEATARAAPDGHTLLLALTSLVINPHLQKLAFDPLAELAPVAQVSRTQFVLLASPALPVDSVPGLLAHARERPGRVACAHAGGATQVACALLAALGRVELLQVPYKGNTLALNDLARGDVHLVFEGVASAAPHLRAGKLRALAVTDTLPIGEGIARPPLMGDVLPGFEVTSWQGVVAPAGTPAAVLGRLSEELAGTLEQPEVRRRLAEIGVHARHEPPERFAAFLRREYARYGAQLRAAGLATKLRAE